MSTYDSLNNFYDVLFIIILILSFLWLMLLIRSKKPPRL